MIQRVVSASVCLLMVGLAPLSAADVSTLTGKKYSGDIVSIRDGVLTVRTPSGPVGVAVSDLYTVDFGKAVEVAKPEARIDEIELTDGTVLKITGLAFRSTKLEPAFLTIANVPAPKVELPMPAVFYLCRNAGDAKVKAEWRKLIATRGKRDWLVVKQAEAFSPLPGTILGGTGTGDAIEFEREDTGQKTVFKLSRISGGLVFNQPTKVNIPATLCRLTDRFGNIAIVQSIQIAKGSIAVQTLAGVKMEYPSFDAFAKWDFSQGNITYLSDLEPKVQSASASAGEPTLTHVKDRSPDGEMLKLQGVNYAKGLWLYPDATLTYTLNQDFREFKFLAGLDDSVPVANAAVTLTVKADGKTIFSEAFTRKDKARPLNFVVTGVKELQLSLDGTGLYLGQQLNLVEAKLQK